MADCVNSSPPLISLKIHGIRWNLGEIREIREISGKFRGIQWNSVGLCMALSMNSVGIPGFRANAAFQENREFGAVSGDLGPQKAFAQIATPARFHPDLCKRTLGIFRDILSKAFP